MLKQTIWLQLTLNFPIDLESPGFELVTFQFQSRRSTTELTRRISDMSVVQMYLTLVQTGLLVVLAGTPGVPWTTCVGILFQSMRRLYDDAVTISVCRRPCIWDNTVSPWLPLKKLICYTSKINSETLTKKYYQVSELHPRSSVNVLYFLWHAAYFWSTSKTQPFLSLPFFFVLIVSIFPLKYQSQMTKPLIFSNARMRSSR